MLLQTSTIFTIQLVDIQILALLKAVSVDYIR